MTYGEANLYADLHASRERLCRAQTHVPLAGHRDLLQSALDNIDRVGVFHCPQWSKFDEPPLAGDGNVPPFGSTQESIAAALAPFGWTCGDDFWRRYYTDAWIFNLANAVEALTRAAKS